jgi:hypothetical protein
MPAIQNTVEHPLQVVSTQGPENPNISFMSRNGAKIEIKEAKNRHNHFLAQESYMRFRLAIATDTVALG